VIGEDKKFLMSVGRLDYNSEGIILITNDGELARILELPENTIIRVSIYYAF
jgi:23S rRNA pseudouridine2605 synthase